MPIVASIERECKKCKAQSWNCRKEKEKGATEVPGVSVDGLSVVRHRRILSFAVRHSRSLEVCMKKSKKAQIIGQLGV